MAKLKKTKHGIIMQANELTIECEAKRQGCTQCTFVAIVDALRRGGLEIIPKDMEDGFFWDRRFEGWRWLDWGGYARRRCQWCVSDWRGSRYSGGHSMSNSWGVACVTGRDTIVDEYSREYGSILCKDVQRKFFGEAWDLTDKELNKEFSGLPRGRTITQTAAMWTGGIVRDESEKGNDKGRMGSPKDKA